MNYLLIILIFSSSSCCDTNGSPPLTSTHKSSIEYIDPTLPPVLPGRNPKCSLLVLRYDSVDDAVGLPPISVSYAPPRGCPASSWSHVVLELSASSHGVRKDHIAAVWLDGAEILRTSTPNPMSSTGIRWRVRKDVTRYAALLRGSQANDATVSMTFENNGTGGIPLGVYSANVSLHFYHDKVCRENGTVPSLKLPTERLGYSQLLSAHPKIKGLYDQPADSIVPISSAICNCSLSPWFKIMNETDLQVSTVQIPNNTHRAVLEVYVSHREDDECWYAEPLEYSKNLSATAAKRNGAFRQVAVSIDKRYVGAVMPFPVIYPGSINPFFWAPVAAIGAYDHPSYDIDLTPFLGFLLDGRDHEFGLTVRYARPHWLVSANLHLWLDPGSDLVTAGLIRYKVPPLKMKRKAGWDHGDGKSSIRGKVIERFSGWVSSSKGNVTTRIKQKLKFKSQVEVKEGGTIKLVEMKVKSKMKLKTEEESNSTEARQLSIRRDTPLFIRTWRSKEGNKSVVVEKTKMSHQLAETIKVGNKEVVLADRQDSEGSLLIENGTIARGGGDTKSTYKFRDDEGCYLRTMIMEGGKLKEDVQTASCASTEAS